MVIIISVIFSGKKGLGGSWDRPRGPRIPRGRRLTARQWELLDALEQVCDNKVHRGME